MWHIINRIGIENRVIAIAEPSDNEFYEYFKDISSQQDSDYFDDKLENVAVEFLTEYFCKYESEKLSLVAEIINSNFTQEEIICAINSLKPNRSPGIDGVPGEFVKARKEGLAEPITLVLNYIIEHRNFPDSWAVRVRSAVFKSGKHNLVDNVRCITILPTIEKIFEAAVYRRLTFVNEAFNSTKLTNITTDFKW